MRCVSRKRSFMYLSVAFLCLSGALDSTTLEGIDLCRIGHFSHFQRFEKTQNTIENASSPVHTRPPCARVPHIFALTDLETTVSILCILSTMTSQSDDSLPPALPPAASRHLRLSALSAPPTRLPPPPPPPRKAALSRPVSQPAPRAMSHVAHQPAFAGVTSRHHADQRDDSIVLALHPAHTYR